MLGLCCCRFVWTDAKHVVVVQDLSSRYPAAKLVSSTSASTVIPALSDIYDSYGNPSYQLSDNGAPFNSNEMAKFADKRNIKLQKIPPVHPVSNPAETFMKPDETPRENDDDCSEKWNKGE